MINFKSYSALNAYLAGLAGLAYAIAFVVLKDPFWSALFLLLGGLLAIPVMVALYGRLHVVEPNFALIVLVLGVTGAIGTAIHGGYDLANVINPPQGPMPNLPHPVDPRGLLAFGITGIALLKISWLMGKSQQFGKGLSLLGYLSGILLLVIYLARLIILDPTKPILLYTVLLEGFIVNPLWYLWLGLKLK